MIILTTDAYPGREIEALGLVKGSVVMAKNIGRDFMAGMKNLVGGELKGYTEMLEDARAEAISRMTTDAQNMGADAIVGMRLTTSSIVQGSAEIVAYGTAVKVL